jgi:hypothetical protein
VEVAGAVHLATALVDQRAVPEQGQQPVRDQVQVSDEVDDQAAPELVLATTP